MASVHLARRLGEAGFARVVAVKVLHDHLVQDAEFVSAFLDEARLSARIRHPNVVDVYDVATLEGRLSIVMEHVEGAALSALLSEARRRGQPLPAGFTLRVVHDALRGLQAAHDLTGEDGTELGLVHRDVSPQNILVGSDGMTRVVDFGVAKAAGRLGVTRDAATVKGKLAYLSPEQLRRGPLDRRADVFAAGIVLWECLTLRSLFGSGTHAETVGRVLEEPITPPSVLAPGVPPALDEVCLRALERDPERRHRDAAAFADALEHAGVVLYRAREVAALVEDLARERIAATRAALAAPSPPVTAANAGAPPARANGPPHATWVGGVTEPLPTAPLAMAPARPAAGRPPRRRAMVVIGAVLAAIAAAALWLVGSGDAHPSLDAAGPVPAATTSTQATTSEVPAAPPVAPLRPAEAVADGGTSADQGDPGAAAAPAATAEARPAGSAAPRASARGTAAGKRVFVPSDL
jgi:serine/threonine-protein kinase